jgi:hypothetical protein
MLGILAACLAFGAAAWAREVPIVGTKTKGQIKAACDKAGGDFMVGPSSFGCSKSNCDGKGGFCTVSCTNGGKCTGSTPGRKVPGRFGNIDGVLRANPTLRQVPGPAVKTTAPRLRANAQQAPVMRPKLKPDRALENNGGRRR